MFRRLLLILTLALASCNGRPGPEVLAPDAGNLPEGGRLVRVLTVTTRVPEAQSPGVFGATRSTSPSWLEYEVSVPPAHQPGRIEWPDGANDAAKNFTVRHQTALSREAFAARLPRAGVAASVCTPSSGFAKAGSESTVPPESAEMLPGVRRSASSSDGGLV